MELNVKVQSKRGKLSTRLSTTFSHLLLPQQVSLTLSSFLTNSSSVQSNNQIVTPRILIAQLYSNTSESLDFLFVLSPLFSLLPPLTLSSPFKHNSWSPSLQQSTIHILDLCQALYLTSLWSLEKGKNEALRLAGEVLSYSLGGGGKEGEIIKEGLKGLKVEGMAGKEEKTRVVLFNVVDEGDTKLGDIASIIGTVRIFFFPSWSICFTLEEVAEKKLSTDRQ